jgi:hypothetical protein
MTATNNPQTATDQARATYRQMTDQLGHLGLDAAVPEGVRALAEKSVAQTRQAYDRSLDAFDTSLTTFERTFDAAGQGATAFNRKIIDIDYTITAKRNVDMFKFGFNYKFGGFGGPGGFARQSVWRRSFKLCDRRVGTDSRSCSDLADASIFRDKRLHDSAPITTLATVMTSQKMATGPIIR